MTDPMDPGSQTLWKRRGSDPLAKLEGGGGAVWVRSPRRRQGPLVILTSRRPDRGAVVVEGRIDLAAFHDMAKGGAILSGSEQDYEAMIEALMSLGWRAEDFLTRSWTLRSDLDRSDLRRTVEASVGLIAPLYGDKPSDFRLMYQPPGGEDAGTAQVGCVLAIPSVLVGDLIGLTAAIVASWSLELLVGVGVFALVAGFGVGYMVLGSVAPRVLALVPALRWQAADLGMVLMLILPGVVALGTWLVIAQIGFRDGRLLFNVSAWIVIGGTALSLLALPVFILWEKWRR